MTTPRCFGLEPGRGAVVQFADGTGTGTVANAVSLGSVRNIQGVKFGSATAGHNYTTSGAGSLMLDNTVNGASATLSDTSVAGNVNAVNVPISLNSDLVASVTNAGTRMSVGGATSGTGRKVTVSGNGTVAFPGIILTPAARQSIPARSGRTTRRTHSVAVRPP